MERNKYPQWRQTVVAAVSWLGALSVVLLLYAWSWKFVL